MTEADHAETYEQRVQAIQLANQPILDGFENALKQAGLSEQTIKDHVDNRPVSAILTEKYCVPYN